MTLEARLRLERSGARPFRLDVELVAPAAVLTAVVGPSGAGKTTLLRCLAGLERAEGWVRVGGRSWQEPAAGRFVATHRRAVGYVFQEPSLFSHLSVRANLEYGWRRARSRGRTPAAPDEVIARLELAPLLGRPAAVLSGGERQRVALGRALLSAPELLLLDEPLASLDPAGRAEVYPYLERLHRELGFPVVYVTHSRAEVLRLAGRVALMSGGRIVAAGSLPEMAVELAEAPGDLEDDAGAVIEARVAGHDDADGVTLLDFSGGRVLVPRREVAPGETRRLRVRARDVSLALGAPVGTSILNVFPARVLEIRGEEGREPLVVLEIGAERLLARITRRSLRELAVTPGQRLFAQVKAVALL